MLRPDILGAPEFDVLTLVFPSANCREARRRVACLGPKAEIYRWPSRAPCHATKRHSTIGGPEVFAVGEEVRVGVEIGSGRFICLGVFNLLVHRIRIDHDTNRTS